MPELAEVAFYARQWDAGVGRRVARAQVRERSRLFRGSATPAEAIAPALEGAVFRGAQTHGKNLLFEFGAARGKAASGWLLGHLGMTGELRAEPPDYAPGRHDHLVLFQRDLTLVFADPRMFGRLRFFGGPEVPEPWQALPPQVLDPAFTKARVAGFLRRRRGTPVKALLLDQAIFPGIGNWMADEILWQARLAPDLRPRDADPESLAAALWKSARDVTRGALRTVGVDWSDPPASWLFQHRWKLGGHCPRRGCGSALARAEVGGRTTAWCPRCQG